MQKQKRFSFVLFLTYICPCQYNMHRRLRVKCPVLLSDLKKNWIFSTDFNKSIKFHLNPSSWSVDADKRTDRQADTDITKLISVFASMRKHLRTSRTFSKEIRMYVMVGLQTQNLAPTRIPNAHSRMQYDTVLYGRNLRTF